MQESTLSQSTLSLESDVECASNSEHIAVQETSAISETAVPHDLTEQPIWSAVVRLAGPALLSMLAFAVIGFFDTWVAGRMSASAQAAIAIGDSIRFFFVLAAAAVCGGTQALVSRAWGERNYQTACDAARQSFRLVIGASALAMISGCLSGPYLFHMMGLNGELLETTLSYFRLTLVSLAPVTLIWTLDSVFWSTGSSEIPARNAVLLTVVVAVLECIFCLAPCKLGVTGIGLAWTIGAFLAVAMNCVALWQTPLRRALDLFEGTKQSALELTWRLLKIGIPCCVSGVIAGVSDTTITTVLAHCPNPETALAAWAVGGRVQMSLLALVAGALSPAAMTLVGQCLGAGKPERAEQIAWQVAVAGAAIAFVVSLPMLLFAHQLAEFMSTERLAIEEITLFLMVTSIANPLNVFWGILSQSMEGAGYVRGTLFNIIAVTLIVRLPIAYLLSFTCGLGSLGCWLTAIITAVLASAICATLFKMGGWKKVVV